MHYARRALILLSFASALAAAVVYPAAARPRDTATGGAAPRLVIFEAFFRAT